MTFEEAVKAIPKGYYEHYKGDLVEVVGIAKHSETLEPMVTYKHKGVLWVRPASMWYNKIDDNRTRFTYIPKPSAYFLIRLWRNM